MAEGKRTSWTATRSRPRWVNAFTAPLNFVLGIGILLVGIVAGAPLALSVSLAVVVYVSAAVQKLLEDQKRGRHLEGTRSGHRDRRPVTTIALEDLAPEIRAEVEEVHRRAGRTERSIDAGDRPYDEARNELDAFVKEAERSARAAQLLQAELSAGADADRLEVTQRIESQLAGYHAEIERLCARLDAVGDDHFAASGPPPDEAGLAKELRELREEMEALAVGVEDAYEQAPT
jgi:hypothetical protein